MVQVSVFLIRHGESQAEVPDPDAKEKKPLQKLHKVQKPNKWTLENYQERLDSNLTDMGYVQAEAALRALGNAFGEAGETRNMALFSAPFQRCVASASMMATAQFEPFDWSDWGLTHPETQCNPTAIPIIVQDGLCDCTPEMLDAGGAQLVLDAGLLLCAGRPFNKAYKKDPIMGQLQSIKDMAGQRANDWADSVPEPEEGEEAEIRMIADVQFLRFEEKDDPYSLTPSSLKFNLGTELMKQKKIMDPPRKGCWTTKEIPDPPSMALETLDQSVTLARQAGCDTVIAVVSPELTRDVCERAGQPLSSVDPGHVVSFSVDVPVGDELTWKLHSMEDYNSFNASSLPPFDGPIDVLVEPPADFQAAMDAAGEQKWKYFAPAPKENIPDNYPPDIPPFGQALVTPLPKAMWAHTAHDAPKPKKAKDQKNKEKNKVKREQKAAQEAQERAQAMLNEN